MICILKTESVKGNQSTFSTLISRQLAGCNELIRNASSFYIGSSTILLTNRTNTLIITPYEICFSFHSVKRLALGKLFTSWGISKSSNQGFYSRPPYRLSFVDFVRSQVSHGSLLSNELHLRMRIFLKKYIRLSEKGLDLFVKLNCK